MKKGYKFAIVLNLLYLVADLATSSVRYIPFIPNFVYSLTLLSLLYAIFMEKSVSKKPVNLYPYRSAAWLRREEDYRWYKNRNKD